MQFRDLAAVADGHAVAFELEHEIVGHRLAQIAATMKQGDQRAAAREPHRGLARRVAAADHANARRSAALRLGGACRVEDADALVGLEPGDGEPAVLGAGGDDDRAGADVTAVLEAHHVSIGAGLERQRAVGRGRAGVELPRLGDGARGQLAPVIPAGNPR